MRKTDAYRRMIAGIQFAAWRNDLTSLVSRTALAQRHFRGFFCVGWFQTPAGLSAFWAQAFSHMLVVLGAELKFRIQFPPAGSLQTISSSAVEPITADGSNAAAS